MQPKASVDSADELTLEKNTVMGEKAKKIMEDSFELTATPNVHYKKFFLKFKEIETLDVSKWKTLHFVSYFCKRYEEIYNLSYTFKFNASPSRCYEIFQINRLVGMLSVDPVVIKDYIDWVFDTKVGNAKKRITAIGFLATQAFVNEYKFTMKKTKEINRSSFLPPKLLEIIDKNEIKNCETYGGLAFLYQAYVNGDSDPKHQEIINQLTDAGLDLEKLSKIK